MIKIIQQHGAVAIVVIHFRPYCAKDSAHLPLQISYKKLSTAQVLHLQSQVDRELSLLELHRIERQNEVASSIVSKVIIKTFDSKG